MGARLDSSSRSYGPVHGARESVLKRIRGSWRVGVDRLPVRFQLQLHKHVWAPDMRGV